MLANVARITPEQAKELAGLVARGTGLMVFMGDQIDPDNYNQWLYQDGAGLLPASLEGVVDQEVAGLLVDETPQSPLEALGELNPAVLERIRIRKYMAVRSSAADAPGNAGREGASIRALARWNNSEASPAVLYKQVGQGRVILWTMAADKAWSDWPTEPSYVLAVREAAKAIARAEGGVHGFTAGEVLRRPVAASVETTSAVVEGLPDRGPQPARIEEAASARGGENGSKVLAFSDTGKAGLYRASWQEAGRETQSDLFAVNPDRRESELARLSPSEVRGFFGKLEPEVIAAASATDTPIAVRGQEIWRPLAAALLGLLAVEAGLACWTGRQR